MFEHSIKVPRHYKVAANIFKKVYTEGGSVKTLLYDEKLRHFRTNVLYALITETIKHAVDIEKIFESCEILTKEPRLDPWLAKILTAELLFGKKTLPGRSKPEQTILSYKEQLEKIVPEQQDDLKSKVVRRPRYVRINTNLLATSDAIRAFQDEGYKFIRCTSGSYNDYLQQIQSLTEYDFTQDYHVKTMFVFAPGTKLHEHDLYLENQIILQDKATALAVHLLAPPPGSIALDMCAAPGMKTTQLAAYLRNQGKIYAVERNENRYQTLCDFVERTGSKCVETLHKDSLEIKRGDCDDVEYILLDPSCSGSGMDLHVHNYIEDTRLARLTSLQEKFLKHAMNSFPNAKRIVYSTCSLFPEENERVITNVVKTSRAKWRVQDVKELLKGQWNNFGSGMYGSMGTRCLYAIPDSDFTTGFFLAVLDRDPKDFEKSQENELNVNTESSGHNKNKKSDKDSESKFKEKIEMSNETDLEVKQKIKKKKKDQITSLVENTTTEIERIENDTDEVTLNGHHKKKKSHKIGVINNSQFEENAEGIETEKELKIKRKKNKKIIDEPNTVNNDGNTATTFEVESENVELRKKKKKRKNDEELSTLEDSEIEMRKEKSVCTEDFENENDSSNHENIKKKKKRKINEDSSIILISDDSAEVKKSKNKSTHIEELENTNDSSNYEITKKKKKRKIKDELCKSIDLTINDDDEMVTKMTKNKSDVEEPEDTNEVNIIDSSNNEELSRTKKKKKKDKKHDISENYESLNKEIETEVINKKHKKKKKNKENLDFESNSVNIQ